MYATLHSACICLHRHSKAVAYDEACRRAWSRRAYSGDTEFAIDKCALSIDAEILSEVANQADDQKPFETKGTGSQSANGYKHYAPEYQGYSKSYSSEYKGNHKGGKGHGKSHGSGKSKYGEKRKFSDANSDKRKPDAESDHKSRR